MTEPILDPEYWAKRLDTARVQHHAIFKCPTDLWEAIAAKHRTLLARHIGACDSILDVGCGWGRLLSLMPEDWCGSYVGIDIASKFLRMAREAYPVRRFMNCSVLGLQHALSRQQTPVDWAVLISFRPMVCCNLGQEYWDRADTLLRHYTKMQLYLEYDLQHEGEVNVSSDT
jgi:cyclopropane fatty-acyl-phospholipid synthase-like methyltransferase